MSQTSLSSRRPIVVGLGELLWDYFPDECRPGGAPANVAFHAHQTGAVGVIASRIGTDAPGREFERFLASRSLPLTGIQRDPVYPTGQVAVTLEDGQPSYTIHEGAAWDELRWTIELATIIHRAAAVCFGTLAQRSPTARETIHLALQATKPNCLIAFDVNLRQSYFSRDIIECSLRRADLVKLNEEELHVLSDLLGIGETQPIRFAEVLRGRYRIARVCLTRGADGAMLIGEAGAIEEPGRPVNVVDAVGAGDAFTAMLLTSLLKGNSDAAALRRANRMGGMVASRSGAMPVIDSDLLELT